MKEYYTSIILIIIFMMAIMIVIITSNNYLTVKKKNSFASMYVCIMIVSFCECFGAHLDNTNNVNLVLLHLMVKLIELLVAPLISAICALSIFKPSSLEQKALIFILLLHSVIELVSVKYNFIFYIDASNVFRHGNLYNIYLFTNFIALAFLFISAKRFSETYQNKDANILILILIFIVSGTLIQMYDPNLKTDWLTIAVASMFIYIYYNELVQYIDGLTKLLNQRSYLKYTNNMRSEAIIVIFDIDNFKKVNDNFGHQFGNECLVKIASLIKACYGKQGFCYRIGGDEFCVIVVKALNDIEVLNERFQLELSKIIAEDNRIPHVSLGFAAFDPQYSIVSEVVEKADQSMYSSKHSS